MYGYGWALATPGTLTTNGSANTETDAIFVKAAASNTVALARVDVAGSVSGATTLSTIKHRMCRFTTGSTAGTGITPTMLPGADAPASAATMASRPTAGSVRQEIGGLGFSQAGGGVWVPADERFMPRVRGNSGDSIDLLDISAATSQVYEIWGQIMEW
jgi:hypothetical protein